MTQSKQMREQLFTMMLKLMGRMLQHMQSGMMKSMRDSMSGCLMMQSGQGINNRTQAVTWEMT